MRVNHQNYVRLIGFLFLMVVAAFSGQVYAKDDSKKIDIDMPTLQAEAEKGIPESQYQLGKLYEDGVVVPRNLQMAYVWYSMAAAQDHDKAKYAKESAYSRIHRNYKSVAVGLERKYFEKYARPFIPTFEVNVNGQKMSDSGTVEVETPLYIIFKHLDENISLVRMLYPKNIYKHEDFELGRPYRMEKHEALLDAGRTTGAMFMALDGNGNVYEKVKIIMKPAPKGDKTDEQGEKTEVGTE